jgi:hypothetical protein
MMTEAWGPGPVFLGYAVMGILAFLFVQTLVPETKGRSLEDIERGLERKAGIEPKDERARSETPVA